ncbi:MAG: class I SAM-dependent methyltransferase [Rhodospirillales bacterium]|nr:class I SAM-dependent methyltransferase [Rhodospirillales bacterium]
MAGFSALRGSVRRVIMGLATVLGIARRGFFIPYRYAGTVPPPGRRPPYGALDGIFQAHKDIFASLINSVEAHADAMAAIGNEPPPAPRWRQDWFPGMDAAVAYAMVLKHCPGRIIEIGSGHSTRFYVRAVTDGRVDCSVTAIDPAPRASIDELGINVIRSTVHEAGAACFTGLGAGDILSIDSSHILMPGSDVDFLFNVILPILPPGVLIQIHDIFLPEDYPRAWSWRGYNEQLAVAALIQGGGYQILWSSRFVKKYMQDELQDTVLSRLPISEGAYESSVWLMKRDISHVWLRKKGPPL